MAFCHLLLVTMLLVGTRAVFEDNDIIEIDSDDEEQVRRVVRQAEEGSGMWDYNIDDEDAGTEIVSSRIVPVASSPTFHYSSAPATPRAGGQGGLTSAIVTTRPAQGPNRPPRLNSYYPDLRQEGSGGGESYISTGLGHYNDSDLISPTRAHNFPGQVTSLVPGPGQSSKSPNHEPFINSRLDKVPLTAGKSSR